MQTVTNRSCFRSIFRIRSPPLTGGPRARHRRRERFPMEDRHLNVVRNCASSSALEVAGSLRAALERNKLSLHGGRWRLPHRVFPSLPGGGYTNVTECGASGFAPVRGGHHVLRAIGLRGGFLLQRWQHFLCGVCGRRRTSAPGAAVLFTGGSEGVDLPGRRPHAPSLR